MKGDRVSYRMSANRWCGCLSTLSNCSKPVENLLFPTNAEKVFSSWNLLLQAKVRGDADVYASPML